MFAINGRRILFLFFFIGSFVFIDMARAMESFIVKKIDVQGLQRIGLSTITRSLTIKKGELLTSAKTADIIRNLYKTGFFSDVVLLRKNNTLIVRVTERSVIGVVNISGNKKITTKQLLEALKNVGLFEGQLLDDAILSGLKQALMQQYYALGYQDVAIVMKVKSMERNRVALNIVINEGIVTKVRSFKITGNQDFSTRKMLKIFSLTSTKPWSFITGANQYSKEKLDSDLDNLRHFYLDRGYLQFKINSVDVEFSPDKKYVDIVIDVNEGSIYRISGWNLKGDLLDKEQEIRGLITFKRGSIFSRKELLDINDKIGKLFGSVGYAKPDIKIDPKVNNKTRELFLTIIVSPGRRFYVRRIEFFGNYKTKEHVLRREMRQQEGGVFSLDKIIESKRRLNNLGYLQDVDVKFEPVVGRSDQLDIVYTVKEVSSAGASVQFGYSDTDRFLFGANINEQNFLGSGKGVGLQFNRSSFSTIYSFKYFNPYYTRNNISLDFQMYDQRVKPGAIRLSSYSTDSYGLSAIYGIPLSDYNRINLGYGFEHTQVTLSSASSSEMQNFINEYGDTFDAIKLIAGWSYSKLDRAIFPTLGFANSFNVEIGLPAGLSSDLEYYKGMYRAIYYRPLTKYLILRLNGDFAYGGSYGSMKDFPLFKNFYCGGIGSVRGYAGNSLGPLDSKGNPLGGNVLLEGSLGVIFPNPLGESVRTTAFVDVGNVFKDQLVIDEMRASAGIQAEWRAPIGVVFTFSLASPLNKKSYDRRDSFQFNIGASV